MNVFERQQHLFLNISILCDDGVTGIRCENISHAATQTEGICNYPFRVISELSNTICSAKR